MSKKNCDFYVGKVALAPMVRAGRTPLRLLALSNGADIVYTEEIIDQKLLASTRVLNEKLGTVDFINGDEIVLRVASEEASHCVLQIGTNSPENAVEICNKCASNVAAIDVNMGCPKPFSISGGMGAALLSKPDLVKEILESMTAISKVPISCKIRVLNSREKTLEFAKMVERCGISALAVHGRQRDERPRHANRTEEIREVARMLSIPVLANGSSQEIKVHEDIERFRLEAGTSSVMLGRVALSHPSIFRSDGLLTMDEEIFSFLEKVCLYDEHYTPSKYVIQRILGSQQEFDPRGKATVLSASSREICQIWSHHDSSLCRWNPSRCRQESLDTIAVELGEKYDGGGKMRNSFDDIHAEAITFPTKKLRSVCTTGLITPKCVLKTHCQEKGISNPIFETRKAPNGNGRFESIVSVQGKRFMSTIPQPTKKMAEQHAAQKLVSQISETQVSVSSLVALRKLNLRHKLAGEWED